MRNIDIQQNGKNDGSYLDFPHPSYGSAKVPVKKKIQDTEVELLRVNKFKTDYPLTKKEDWVIPKCEKPGYKNYCLTLFLIVILIPLLLLFMPLAVLYDYKNYLLEKRRLRKELSKSKQDYLNEW
ncbi:hypothetical protein GCM10007916_23240 [Psychromonas marina]|uniref:Uncharacterized protein n=1 Tax=Psychromonas marina TaxID=88364 RepID=A0ABQ6E1Q1_9GAMM|nr:hypothetical protein [Psychromonas marina]GLS91255.1 hypothetical protein GCM10007916_23240 [Psychromonas marina]